MIIAYYGYAENIQEHQGTSFKSSSFILHCWIIQEHPEKGDSPTFHYQRTWWNQRCTKKQHTGIYSNHKIRLFLVQRKNANRKTTIQHLWHFIGTWTQDTIWMHPAVTVPCAHSDLAEDLGALGPRKWPDTTLAGKGIW